VWLVEKSSNFGWPDDIIDIVEWYAINDADPPDFDPNPEEVFRTVMTDSSESSRQDDPYFRGINSGRGTAAEAIGRILLARPELFGRLKHSVRALSKDRSVAVRSCALVALLATLNVDAPTAISWFKDCVAMDPVILATPFGDASPSRSRRP
jgi:hypothetical protein